MNGWESLKHYARRGKPKERPDVRQVDARIDFRERRFEAADYRVAIGLVGTGIALILLGTTGSTLPMIVLMSYWIVSRMVV